MAFNNYFYNFQIRNYIIQFMAIFAGLQVQVGKSDTRDEGLIPVHIKYGSKDRVAASILTSFTQNKQPRVPLMSAYITGFELAPERRKGIGVVRRESFLPRGEILPDGIKNVKQYMPIPYWVNAEIAIWTSNIDQHWQILEQILMVFDPILQIQKNDATFDWTRVTTVELMGIRLEENYPMDTARRIIQTGLDFRFLIYISPPADLKKQFVRDIFLRLGVFNLADNIQADVVGQMDDLGIDYELLFSAEDLVLPDPEPEPDDES